MKAFKLSIGLGFLVLFLWGGLMGYAELVKSRIEKQKSGMQAIFDGWTTRDPRVLLKFYSQLGNLKDLLSQDTDAFKLFPFLEDTKLAGIKYGSWNASISDRSLRISGWADSEKILSRQIAAFETSGVVEKIEVSKSNSASQGISFQVNLILKPIFFAD